MYPVTRHHRGGVDGWGRGRGGGPLRRAMLTWDCPSIWAAAATAFASALPPGPGQHPKKVSLFTAFHKQAMTSAHKTISPPPLRHWLLRGRAGGGFIWSPGHHLPTNLHLPPKTPPQGGRRGGGRGPSLPINIHKPRISGIVRSSGPRPLAPVDSMAAASACSSRSTNFSFSDWGGGEGGAGCATGPGVGLDWMGRMVGLGGSRWCGHGKGRVWGHGCAFRCAGAGCFGMNCDEGQPTGAGI